MVVVLNGGAGAAAKESDTIREDIKSAFAAAGASVTIVQPRDACDLDRTVREAAASTDRIVVAAGGDGTVSAVAAGLVRTGKTLGVLPIGTLNHFAKDIGVPLALQSAAQAIVDGNVISVDVAEVNGRIFINNSSLGIYPHIVVRREAQQERLARGKWPAFVWATIQALKRFPFLDLRITVQGQRLARRTAFVFIGNNEYEIAGFKLGGRACVNRGKLGLYVTHRTGRAGLFRLALRALVGRLEQAKDFDGFCVEEAVIEARRPSLLVATDGEVVRMETPLHYKTLPGALRVLVPRSEQQE